MTDKLTTALIILCLLLLIAGWACAVISFSYAISLLMICSVLYEAKKLNKL